MGAILKAAAAGLLALALAGPADAVSVRTLAERGLPSIKKAGIDVYHSVSVAPQAAVYAEAMAAAVRWYRRQLPAWTGPLRLAVLDRDDWAGLASLPYPTPYANLAARTVIMPGRIDSHAGFDLWDIDGTQLSIALGLHEIGHVIAYELGFDAGANPSVSELFANLFLAGYVRAERPDLAHILVMPRRFTAPGPFRSFADLDANYGKMPPLNYAWYQFRLVEVADAMVRNGDFAALAAGFVRAFPSAFGRPPRRSAAEILAALERLSPGITAALGELAAGR